VSLVNALPWLKPHVVVAAIMVLTALAATAYVLRQERHLLKSPVSLLLIGAPAYTAVMAYAFGELRPRYQDDPWALSLMDHLLLQLGGAFTLSAIMVVTAANLPESVKRRRRLRAAVVAAPWLIGGGYLLSTLVLLHQPHLPVEIGADTSAPAFVYRGLLELPMICVGLISFAVWALAHKEFGEPKTESEAARKKRFLPAAFGGLAWALLYLDHFAVPLAAFQWPRSSVAADPSQYVETIMLPIFGLLALSYLLTLVRPYRPSGLLHRMHAFSRYNNLTEILSFRVRGHMGHHWMLRYRFARATRLIALVCDDLNLPSEIRVKAISTYALAAVAKAGPNRAARALPPHDATMNRFDLQELYSLHNQFLHEPEGSPRRAKALENRYAPLVPNALMLIDEGRTLEMRAATPDVQLASLPAADFGLLSEDQRSALLDRSSSVHSFLLEAYERAKREVDKHRAC
jgi:hypothetical protein